MRNLAKLLLARGIAVSGSDLKDSQGPRRAPRAGCRRRGRARRGARPAIDPTPSSSRARSASERGARGSAATRRSGVGPRAGDRRAGRRAARRSRSRERTARPPRPPWWRWCSSAPASTRRFLIGGDLNESGSGARAGDGELFVFEADESDGSFLLAPPSDRHHDERRRRSPGLLPGGREEIEAAFAEFAARCERRGRVRRRRRRAAALDARGGAARVTYGTDPANDVEVGDRGGRTRGGARSVADPDGAATRPLRLAVDGAHNLLNAAAADRRPPAIGRGRRPRCRGGARGVPRASTAGSSSGARAGRRVLRRLRAHPTEMAVTLGRRPAHRTRAG